MLDSLKSHYRQRSLNQNVTVIIRGVGERTEHLCHQLLARQIEASNIHLIHEAPFSKAVKTTFETGIADNRKWTLVVDADVLVGSHSIRDFYERAEAAPATTFVLLTEMLDKFFGGTRAGGLKLYRTKLLPNALGLVPDVAHRPEGSVNKAMHQQGFYLDITDLVCGLHDFEQYYFDIFRKGFAHGLKHGTLLEALVPYWRAMAKTDTDFVVLLAGLEVSKRATQELLLDKDEVKVQFEDYVRTSGQHEKKTLSPNIDYRYVDELLRTFKTPPQYKTIKAAIDKLGRPQPPAAAPG